MFSINQINIDFDNTKIGTYSLLVDNFQDTLTGTVYMDNIKTSSGNEQYTISWTGVISGAPNAVGYTADYNSDGTPDLTLSLPSVYQDSIAPIISIISQVNEEVISEIILMASVNKNTPILGVFLYQRTS